MDKIISGKYLSYLFDEQISEGRLSAEECLIYMKMLIYCEAANCQRRKLQDRIGSFPFLTAQFIQKKHFLSGRTTQSRSFILWEHIVLIKIRS